jgi:hypothetical protein
MDDNDLLTLVTQGIKLKDVEPENVRGTPSYSGIQLTEGQQEAKDQAAEAQVDNISVPTTIGEAVSMQIDSLKDDIKSTAIYRNIFGNDAPDETRLANSEKLGSALGISPQILASNLKMYDTALIQYDRQRNAAFLDNKPFTPTTLSDMYPELDMDDPVAVTMALKDSNAVLKGRTTIAAMSGLPALIASGISDEAAFIKDNWNAGRDIDEASNIKYDLYTGNIDLDTALNKLQEIESRPEMQNEGRGPNYVLGQTIRMNSQMARNIADGLKEIVSTLGPQAAQYINQIALNAGAIGTMGTAAAVGAVGLTGTAAAVPIGVAGAAAGIGLGTLGILVGTYKAQVGDNYLQYISEKNPDGTRVFTNTQARAMARRDAALQAVVETGVTNYAYGAVGSVFSMAGRKVAAQEAIKDAGAIKKVIKAGTDAYKESAKKAAAKKAATQFVKATASEVAEEGIQSAISDIDERASGYQGMSYKRMFDDATDAMWQALPAVVGTMLPGSLIHGAGAYVGINKLSQADFDAARTMMERNNEKGMIDRLMDIRDKSSLFKNSTKTYAATVQNQLEKAEMGKVYIDAQTAAENPETHAALNQLVSTGAITEKDLNESITTGKPLEIDSGKYLQTATPEMNTALENYRTLDKGERTIHDLQEIRNRAKELRDIVQSSQKEREAMASQKILNEHFKGDTEQGREDRATMAELLSGGLTDLKENAKNALNEAIKDWTNKLPNAQEHVDYIRRKQKGQGTGEVGIIARENDSQGGQWESTRVSSNEGWYSDVWKQKGSMPTQRDILDYDHEQYLKELEASVKPGDAEGEMEIQSITEAKKRVESLERVSDVINSMDKDDLVARTLLDTETYDKAYKPYLAQINAAAKDTKAETAAKESALILSKIAENLKKNYGIPLEKSMAEIVKGGDPTKLNQMAGEHAIAAPEGKLRTAASMEENGKSPEEIWKATGWMRRPDHKWRFEIRDNLDKIDFTPAKDGKPHTLEEIYDNPTLYEAYPELKGKWVHLESIQRTEDKQLHGASGYVDDDGNIVIDEGIPAGEAKKALVHEIQHVIQEREGFSGEGNIYKAKEQISNSVDHLLVQLVDLEIKYPEVKKYVDKMDSLYDMLDHYDENDLLGYLAKVKALKSETETMFKDLKISRSERKKLADLERDMQLLEDAAKQDDYAAYRRLGGEAEAFMTQARADDQTERQRDIDLDKESEARIKRYEDLKKTLPLWELDNLKTLEKLENEVDSYRKRPDHDFKELVRKIKEAADVRSKIPTQHYVVFESAREAKKNHTYPDLPMPNYDTPYGPAVINFDGKDLPFMMGTKAAYHHQEWKYGQSAVKKNAEPDLIVTHNITPEKLESAIKLGGLPVPSLGISKKGMKTGLDAFGGITLIGNKEMIDPKKSVYNDVFSRDAYTATFPRIEYDKPSDSEVKSFVDRFKEAFSEVGFMNRSGDISELEYRVRNSSDQQDLVHRMSTMKQIRYYYVTRILGKQVKIPMKKVAADKYGIVKNASLRKQLSEDLPKYESKEYVELSKKIYDKMKDYYTKKYDAEVASFYLDKYFINGSFNINMMHDLQKEARGYGKTEPDRFRFADNLEKYVLTKDKSDLQPKYRAWLESETENLFTNPGIRIGRRKEPITLDNVVEAMLKERGSAKQKNLVFGDNELLAGISKKFKSISQIKKAENVLAPDKSEEAMENYGRFKRAMNDLRDICYSHNEYPNGMDVLDDLNRAVVDAAKGKVTDEKIIKSLRKHFFTNNPEAMLDEMKEAINAAKGVMTDYFEAKPARAVSFSEFSGAVVPKGTKKEITSYLKSQGLTVKTYDPKKEGDQKAKTEDLAAKLNVYFQSGGGYQGSYDPKRKAIELFDGASQSTVIHEGAHMFLSALEQAENLTEEDIQNYFGGNHEKAAASLQKVKKDLAVIRGWAAYSDKHLEEYKGTSLEKEFMKHSEDVRNGVEGAEEIWMQERFARGFEKYLIDGVAPTKEMKGVFRRFKSWLVDIYKTAKSLGKAKLTPEIRDIFDHMIATDSEIEAWAAQRKLDSIDKAMNVNETEAENFKRWSEEVKEKAKEAAMSYYMKTMKSDALDNFRKSIDTEENRRDFERKLAEENPIYMIEQLYNSGNQTEADKRSLLKMNGLEEKDFLNAVKEMGGTTKERWNKHIEDEVKNFKENMLTEQDVRSMAESVLESPEGLQKRSQIEAHLLEKRVNQYIAQVTSSQLKLKRAKDKAKVAMEIKERLGLVTSEEKAEMGRQAERITRDEDKIQKLEERVNKLKDQLKEEKEKSEKAESRNKTSGEVIDRLNGNIKALQDELEKERAKSSEQKDTITESEATVADLSSQLEDMVNGLKESRKAMRLDYKLMKDDAASTLGEETVSHATSWRWWENKARIANVRGMKAMEMNDFEEAAYQKQVETQDILMSRMAKENIDEIKHALHGGGKLTTVQNNEEGMDRYGILGILNRIGRKEKPVLMNDDARYFVQHLAYMAGITNYDGELPLDENGLSRPFEWKSLNIDLNPDAEMGGPNLGKEVVAPWMIALFDSRDPRKMMDLKMNDLREIFKAIKAVYKIGRREYEGNTLGTSFEDAADKIQDEIMTNWTHSKRPPLEKALQARTIDRAAEKLHKLVKDITLPEILIERMGKEFYQYVYVPIDKASAVRRKMKQDANKKIQGVFSMYSRKEWTSMRSKKDYTYGYDSTGQPYRWTKEQVICMALNMGTESNRARLMETVGGNEAQMLDFLDKTLDKRDWDFVEGIWSHVNGYWGERNKIQNDLYGTPMGKVPGLKIQLKNGRTIEGMYYPIKYDRKLAGITNERAANEIAAEDLQGISAFALGMGSTKSREKGSGGQLLRLDLDVYTSHISEAIQHVSMREATVDVYKLLSRKEVVSTLERTIGPEGLNMLRQWVSDNWHSSIIEMSEWNGTLNRLRHNYAFATMGYRVSTALLNVLNIFGMMDRMGAYNALKATADFYFGGGPNAYSNVRDQYRFITQKSTYMKERAANMDRDMALGDKIQVGQNESEVRSLITHEKYGIDKINSGAFKIMAWTDEMFSLPEWMATYKGTMRKLSMEGKLSQEEMNAEAVRLADKAVRETFGSGEVKDQTAFMRRKGPISEMTAFFSYTNLVTNQFIRAGYEMYDHRNIKPLLTATLFWWLLNGFFETCLRELWDDSNDDDKWKKKLAYVMASGSPLGGVPVIRDALPNVANYIMKGGKVQLQDLAPDVPALGALTYLGKALQSIYKGDDLETGRNINKAISRSTPFSLPDTIVDGYWNFLRLMSTDSHTLTEFIYKSAFDKELKEEKGGKK